MVKECSGWMVSGVAREIMGLHLCINHDFWRFLRNSLPKILAHFGYSL